MQVTVVVYPGSVGAEDVTRAFSTGLGTKVTQTWHRESELPKPDLVVIPGGASFGDVLRPGAVARLSPITPAIVKHARRGGYLLGIGNGFQILCELELLPGCLLINATQRFNGKQGFVRAETNQTPFFHNLVPGDVLSLPLAHRFGRYHASDETIRQLESAGQIALRYCSQTGEISEPSNVNSSRMSIAAVCDERGHVLGMMPHPERQLGAALGGEDGLALLGGIVDYLAVTRS